MYACIIMCMTAAEPSDKYIETLKDKAKKEFLNGGGCNWPVMLGNQGSYRNLTIVSYKGNGTYRHNDIVPRQEGYIRRKTCLTEICEEIPMITLNELCKAPENPDTPLKVLVDGAPGIGKTTLCRYLQNEWAHDKLLNYRLVVSLNLRDRDISDAKNIDDFFYEITEKENIVQYINESNGKGLLLIFDGFDELSYEKRNNKSLFLDILSGKRLHGCSVIVTSRPYASQSLLELPSVNRHVEILGFTETEIKNCIESTLDSIEKAEDLCKQLQARLDLASLCRIPLNCSIMLFVYKQEKYHLPKTVTELYELLILHTFKNIAKKSCISEWRKMSKLTELPKCTPTFCMRCCFTALCKLAYDGINNDKMVYYEEEVEKVFTEVKTCGAVVDKEKKLLDLMTAVKTFSKTKSCVIYSFNHLTIQEYLTAQWISMSSLHPQSVMPDQFLNENLENYRYELILKFLSGITKMDFHNAMEVLNSFLNKKQRPGFRFLCCLLYESDQSSICRAVADKMYPSKDMTASFVVGDSYSFDCLALANLIICSNCEWNSLEVDGNHLRALHKILKDFETTNPSMISECKFKQLTVAVEMHSLEYLHLLKDIASYYDDLTINTNLKEDSSFRACIKPKISARKFKLKDLEIMWASKLKIEAFNSIYPQLLSTMLGAIQVSRTHSSQLNVLVNGKIVATSDESLKALGNALTELLVRNQRLNYFQFALKQLTAGTPVLLRYLAEGMSKNLSMAVLDIGELSEKGIRELFELFVKYLDRIKISSIHIHVNNSRYKEDDFQKFLKSFEGTNIHQVTALQEVIIHLGYDSRAPKCTYFREKKTSKFIIKDFLTDIAGSACIECHTHKQSSIVKDPFRIHIYAQDVKIQTEDELQLPRLLKRRNTYHGQERFHRAESASHIRGRSKHNTWCEGPPMNVHMLITVHDQSDIKTEFLKEPVTHGQRTSKYRYSKYSKELVGKTLTEQSSPQRQSGTTLAPRRQTKQRCRSAMITRSSYHQAGDMSEPPKSTKNLSYCLQHLSNFAQHRSLLAETRTYAPLQVNRGHEYHVQEVSIIKASQQPQKCSFPLNNNECCSD